MSGACWWVLRMPGLTGRLELALVHRPVSGASGYRARGRRQVPAFVRSDKARLVEAPFLLTRPDEVKNRYDVSSLKRLNHVGVAQADFASLHNVFAAATAAGGSIVAGAGDFGATAGGPTPLAA